MGRRKIDLTGQRFGRLVVVGETNRSSKPDGQVVRNFNCLCECGNKCIVTYSNLTSGNSKSCGCKRSERSVLLMSANGRVGLVEGTDVYKLDQKIQKNNRSGHRGVCWGSNKNKWIASLTFKGVQVLHKSFDNIQDAINARKEAEDKYFKPFLENHGKE